MAGMHSGTVRMIAGVLIIITSVFAMKVTTVDLFWAGIVFGWVLAMSGGVAVSQSNRKAGEGI